MSDKKKEEIPKWPENLPEPTEVKLLPPEHIFYREQLVSDKNIQDLIHDLYYFPEDKYFLYFKSKDSVKPEEFSEERLEEAGLILRNYENYFFRRAYSESQPDKYSYIRLCPGEERFDWQKALTKKEPMYCRVEIELMEWRKKDIDLMRISQIKNPILKSDNDAFILKPSLFGFGIDLKKLYKRIKERYFNK